MLVFIAFQQKCLLRCLRAGPPVAHREEHSNKPEPPRKELRPAQQKLETGDLGFFALILSTQGPRRGFCGFEMFFPMRIYGKQGSNFSQAKKVPNDLHEKES